LNKIDIILNYILYTYIIYIIHYTHDIKIHFLPTYDGDKAFMFFCKTRRCSKSLWQTDEEDGLMELTELWLMRRCWSRSDFVRRASPGSGDGRG